MSLRGSQENGVFEEQGVLRPVGSWWAGSECTLLILEKYFLAILIAILLPHDARQASLIPQTPRDFKCNCMTFII